MSAKTHTARIEFDSSNCFVWMSLSSVDSPSNGYLHSLLDSNAFQHLHGDPVDAFIFLPMRWRYVNWWRRGVHSSCWNGRGYLCIATIQLNVCFGFFAPLLICRSELTFDYAICLRKSARQTAKWLLLLLILRLHSIVDKIMAGLTNQQLDVVDWFIVWQVLPETDISSCSGHVQWNIEHSYAWHLRQVQHTTESKQTRRGLYNTLPRAYGQCFFFSLTLRNSIREGNKRKQFIANDTAWVIYAHSQNTQRLLENDQDKFA